jgi:glycine/D-amino acid oxidase-like deaminating enzyme
VDYDVLVIGSGFGGNVAALRLTEKGYRVGVLEAGRSLGERIQVPRARGVSAPGCASTLCVPPETFFETGQWAGITDWKTELAPYYDQASRMLAMSSTGSYLHLAEQAGAIVHPGTEVASVSPLPHGGYQLTTRSGMLRLEGRLYTANQVVFAAGTCSTQRLLHRCKSSGALPRLSDRLGAPGRSKAETRMAAIGGCTIGACAADGVIDPYHRTYGHAGLHIVDGSAVSAGLEADPALTISAQAERAMAMWPNRREQDPRPALGSAYVPVAPVPPVRPVVVIAEPALVTGVTITKSPPRPFAGALARLHI